ncbi:MAG: hypothetical protein LBF50_03145 [Azoarcus sp.]|jgi:hypothetical protein|nr:hypothetical protein [Azoarcus sp.]
MRRLFAIFFLICLPLQLGWASAAAYCAHERGAAADHFGHHAHGQADETRGDSEGGDGTTSLSGGDCGFCHVACATALLPDAVRMALAGVGQAHAASLYPWPRSAPAAQPERPKWSRPA